MKNCVDENWEIHDANRCILRGTQDEIMFAWNVNYLNDNSHIHHSFPFSPTIGLPGITTHKSFHQVHSHFFLQFFL